MFKVFKEIRKIGIKNWIWFVLYLKRDEFSYKLGVDWYYPDNLTQLLPDRDRAHELNTQLSEINHSISKNTLKWILNISLWFVWLGITYSNYIHPDFYMIHLWLLALSYFTAIFILICINKLK